MISNTGASLWTGEGCELPSLAVWGWVYHKIAERGCAQISVSSWVNCDLTQEAYVVQVGNDFEPDMASHFVAEVGGIGANRDHPGRHRSCKT
jgi:hypothetical protein